MPTNTLTTLRARLPTRMNLVAADVANADIDWAINLGKRRAQRRIDLYWSEASTTLTTAAGSRTLASVPADYHRAYELWIIDGTQRVQLAHIDRHTEISIYPPVTNETRKRPRAWFRRAGSLYVAPTPDAIYTVRVDYWAYLADLVAGADRDAITDNCEELIYAYAAEELSRDRGWVEEARMWREQRLEIERDWFYDMVEEEMGGSVVLSRGTGVRPL